ncbi:hypothetical protein VTJ49DRAFT_1899 [Mycothermus thermophilus]|uniref:Mmc1 C-terminal domain-containing protein n=1 Tax=Humicola insolens TaxID=85995 RepID=A0ABR3VB55_HUMIN
MDEAVGLGGACRAWLGGICRIVPALSTTASTPSSNPRHDLHRALSDLQTHAANYTNLPRLQLALRNLSEPAGHESIRVAVLNLPPPSNDKATNVSNSTAKTPPPTPTTTTAQRLLRLALADPLRSTTASWEEQLEAHDLRSHSLVQQMEHVVPEVRVDAPLLRDSGLEMLVADAGFLAEQGQSGSVEDAVLVPTVDVAATTAGHVAPIATPVHMALLVGDGVLGAARILSLPVVGQGRDVITGAVNFDSTLSQQDLKGCPFVVVNVDVARQGLEQFRADVGNAIAYETLWSASNVSAVSEWLRKGAATRDDGTTKQPVRNLLRSLLRNARAALQQEAARDASAERHSAIPSETVAQLDRALAEWARSAHQELQEQLDLAFAAGAWSRLSWWKLFWRADDVGMAASEVVAIRFLPQAEKNMIYLAGRIREAGIPNVPYSGPMLPPSSTTDSNTQQNETIASPGKANWPQHIPFTRTYLQSKTVPALQALAQRLVVEAASLSGLSAALAGLSYLSAIGAYECGAIAALGIAVACRRMQRKWDAAREYWQGEVREEGRKAVRATEGSVAEVLQKAGQAPVDEEDRRARVMERERVEGILQRAEEALGRLK